MSVTHAKVTLVPDKVIRVSRMNLNDLALKNDNSRLTRMLSQPPRDMENLTTKGTAPARRSLTTQTWNVGSAVKRGMFGKTAAPRRRRRRGANLERARTLRIRRLV